MGRISNSKKKAIILPTYIDVKGEIVTNLNLVEEVFAPRDKGYYLEAIAKLDAYIDKLLNALVRQLYPDDISGVLINSIEQSMKKEYQVVTGLVRLEVLKESKKFNGFCKHLDIPGEDLRKKIRDFKEQRNKALHSDKGHYNLVTNNHKNNEDFQKKAKDEAIKTIGLGVECVNGIMDILLCNNLKKMDYMEN